MKLDDTDFALFGLPQRFEFDTADLDSRWRRLQGTTHPDRHAAEGGAAQRVAMQWSVRINEAYRRLRDPLSRAAYLCELRGAPIRANSNTAMPADFLHQQMAWREALDGAEGEEALQSLELEVRQAEATLFAELGRVLNDPAAAPAPAVELVRALMFIARFRTDLERRLNLLHD
ncbi:MAG: Fe-S protein assembly co-chaperone HscB [Burkholderiaceae bacterium]